MTMNIGASAMSQLAKSMYGISDSGNSDEKNNGLSVFTDVFKQELGKVNNLQLESDEMTQQMAAGNVQNIEEVLIKAEEARIALDLTVQITSKVTQAYQEIMRMQV